MNVVFLGETGVGKSTFINAFVNYLTFDTLDEAEKGNTIAVIPASFLTTLGDDFKEVTVHIGEPDLNEDYSQPGASVTQQCKSYIIPLRDDLHIRLIDTPGMGDTRGIDQDMKNIDHILSYINNLTHLNAVCFLLKPNKSRTDIFFRSCLQQIFTYLTPKAYENISFCFTNTRSTFYAPGDTAPILHRSLRDQQLTAIPFKNTNTFCFDSESFRYLATIKQGITHDSIPKEEFVKSWTKSVKESVRLLEFIQKRERYDLQQWLSPRRTALNIIMFARPLMEKLRSMIYNIILDRNNIVDRRVIYHCTSTKTKLCSQCATMKFAQVGLFRICQHGPERKNNETNCQCPADEKCFLIESLVKYEYLSEPTQPKTKELENELYHYLWNCDQLYYFLRKDQQRSWSDPFDPVLEEFIQEEKRITKDIKNGIDFNKEVYQLLTEMREWHKTNTQELEKQNKRLSLDAINKMMEKLTSTSDVKEHIECVKEIRRQAMKAYEERIPMDSGKNQSVRTIS